MLDDARALLGGGGSIAMAIAVAMVALGTPRVAWAQSAEQRFDEGRAAMARGDYGAACQAFEASFNESGSKGALYNLAQCEDEGHRGRLASSLARWREVQDRYRDKPEIRAEADARVAALEQRVAQLTLRRAPTLPQDASTRLDGKPAGFGVPTPLDAGYHTVEASAPGKPSKRIEINVVDGDRKVLTVSLDEAVVNAPSAPPGGATDEADGGSGGSATLRTAGWIAGGVGVVGLGLFAISLPIQATAESEIEDACAGADRTACGPGAADAASRGETWQVVEVVGLGVGLVGLGLGVTLVVLGSEEDAAVAVRGDRVELRARF